jgi:hypothetical protein
MPLSRHSNDSDDSEALRALEMSEGPLLPGSLMEPGRGRSYSVSGFNFRHDLLPLSSSLSEPDKVYPEGSEKNLSLLNGGYQFWSSLAAPF